MNYYTKVLLLLAVSLFTIKTSNAQWVDCSYGILNKDAEGLAKCDSYLFVGIVQLGIYRSSNDGIDWEYKSNGLPSGLKYGHCFYADGSNIYAGTNNGVYYSSDYGENWIPRGFNNGSSVYSIGKSGQNIIISLGYYSSNNGISWIQCNFPQTYPDIRQFANIGDTIFTVSYNIFSSFDHGVTWTLRDNSRFYYSIYANNNDLYAGSDGLIFKSTNRGSNWYAMNQGLPLSYDYIRILEMHNGMLFTAINHIIYKYSFSNSTWLPTNNYFGNNDYISLLSFNGKLFTITGTVRGGIYYTTNDGNSWNRTKLVDNNIRYLYNYNNKIFACSDSSYAYTSTNNGDTWNSIKINCSNVSSITNINSNIFLSSTDSGIYKSTNEGQSFAKCNTGLSNINILSLNKKDSILYAGSNSGLFYSTNFGSNWNILGFNTKKVSSIGITDSLILIGTNTGLYYSTNNGNNWSAEYISGKTVNVIKKFYNNIYAGVNDNLYCSSNNGLSWTSIGISGKPVYDVTKYADTALFMATGNGLYRSYNNGLYWRTKYYTSYSLLQSNDYIISGGNGVILKALKSSLLTNVIKVNEELPNDYNLFQNYPNPFNPVTKIQFEIPKTSRIKIIIYDINGREIESIVNQKYSSGNYEVIWDASNHPSGIYFCKLNGDSFTKTIKMMLIK